MRNRLMRMVADVYPTHRMGDQKWLAGLWRVFFYGIGPTEPFRFRTRDYEMFAVPDRWHLSRSVVRKGSWERFVTDHFRTHLQPGMTVIDVGANYGHYALTAANAVGAQGMVLAFEPQPGVYADLVRNASLARHGNLQTFAIALGDRDGEAVLAVDAHSSGRSSLVAGLVALPGETITVPVRRLADVLAETIPSRKVGLVKIDTEGFEAQVLAGAWEMLTRDLPVVFTEFSPGRMRQAGKDAEELFAHLLALGYQAKLLDEKRSRLVAVEPPVATWITRYRESLNDVESGDWFVNMVLEPNARP